MALSQRQSAPLRLTRSGSWQAREDHGRSSGLTGQFSLGYYEPVLSIAADNPLRLLLMILDSRSQSWLSFLSPFRNFRKSQLFRALTLQRLANAQWNSDFLHSLHQTGF